MDGLETDRGDMAPDPEPEPPAVVAAAVGREEEEGWSCSSSFSVVLNSALLSLGML